MIKGPPPKFYGTRDILRSGRQVRLKSASVPGLIRRVVIQTKFSSIATSPRPARDGRRRPGQRQTLGYVSDYPWCQVSKAAAEQDATVTRSRAAAARATAWWTNDVAVAERAAAAEEATGNGPAYQAPRVPAGQIAPAGRGDLRDRPPEPVRARDGKIRLRPYSPPPAWGWQTDRCWRPTDGYML
jgi:hypothetical protein